MHCQTVGEDAIVDCIRAYINLQTLPAVQNEALDRLTDSIFRMEVRYISRLLSRRSEIEIDIHLLANDVAYDFLDRYLIGQYRNFVAAEHVIPLLKKMARSGVVNAIRDSHRLCRHPDRSQDYGGRIIQLKFADSITDPKPGGQPGDSLALEELVDEFESRLSDPILRAVYRLMILGFSAIEIAAKLNWEKRTTERLIVQVRKELQSWSESSFYCARGKRQENIIRRRVRTVEDLGTQKALS